MLQLCVTIKMCSHEFVAICRITVDEERSSPSLSKVNMRFVYDNVVYRRCNKYSYVLRSCAAFLAANHQMRLFAIYFVVFEASDPSALT